MTGTHRLDPATLSSLARGEETAAAIELLTSSQLSKSLLFLRLLIDEARAKREAAYGQAEADHSFRVLAQAHRRAPDAVVGVLRYPTIGAWLSTCWRRLGSLTAADLAYLGSIAAAAAWRAGLTATLVVPVHGGVICLPGLGSLDAPGSGPLARLAVPHPGLRDLPRLTAVADGRSLDLRLDSVDPYRNSRDVGIMEVIDDAKESAWKATVTEAWAALNEVDRARAAAVARILRCVIPLAANHDRAEASATITEAFGAIAATRPATGERFAAMLVHELQHAKLGAILDLSDLTEPVSPRAVWYSPWRSDPRPIGGLLHGAFAFLAVADYWRRRIPFSAEPAIAELEYAVLRRQLPIALRQLTGSQLLTEYGERFVGGMQEALSGWEPVDIPLTTEQAAQAAVDDHRATWRLRNIEPDDVSVGRLARAYLDGESATAGCDGHPRSAEGLASQHINPRLDLLYTRLRSLTRPLRGGTDADAHFASGDYQQAADGYSRQIAEQHDADSHAWAGFAVSYGQSLGIHIDQPELLRAVYQRVATTRKTKPEQVAAWLYPRPPS